MASINIRPTAASFSSTGGNGSITITAENDDWHDEPLSGDIWMAQRKLRSDGTWSDWIIFRIVGEKGADGEAPAAVYQGVYSSSKSYYGDSTRTDIVKYGNQYWIARADAPYSPFSGQSPYSGSAYWKAFGASFESVATELLLAERATLEKAVVRYLLTSDSGERVQVEGNVLTMYDSSNNPKLVISGEDLGALQDSYDQQSFSGRTVYASSGEASSTITLWSPTVSSTPNTLTLPPMTITITKDSSAEEFIEAEAFYYVDGDIVSGNTIRGELTYNRTTTMTIPGKTLSLTKGSHSIQLYMQAMTPDSTSLSSISASGVTLDITYTMQAVEIGANGFRAAFSANQYALFTKDGSSAPVFTLLNGNYGFRVTSSGFQRTTTGDTGWTTFNL